DGDARGATTDLDQEPAVTRRGPSGPERDVLAGLSVDVRDAARVVDEPESRPPRHFLVGRLDRREILGKVESVDVSRCDVVTQRGEPGVQGKLIRGVGREGYAAEVARREDVAGEIRSHRGNRGKNCERQYRAKRSFHECFLSSSTTVSNFEGPKTYRFAGRCPATRRTTTHRPLNAHPGRRAGRQRVARRLEAHLDPGGT